MHDVLSLDLGAPTLNYAVSLCRDKAWPIKNPRIIISLVTISVVPLAGEILEGHFSPVMAQGSEQRRDLLSMNVPMKRFIR